MATSVKFITNSGETHKEFLLRLFEQSEEITFIVAFFKKGGLSNIKEYLKSFCNDKSKKSSFYIGTSLGETEPDTLLKLYKIIKCDTNHQLVLCTPPAGIFHPKVYIFRRGRLVTVVTGSSNLTENGWVLNDEVSLEIETTINSEEYQKLAAYINGLHKKYYTDDVENLILRYKAEKENFDKKFGKKTAFHFKREEVIIAGIDMLRLRSYYESYLKSGNSYVKPEWREAQYLQGKKNLEKLASDIRLNDEQFHSLFGPLVGHKEHKPKLWHSGSIHRKTYKTLDYPDSFRELVRIAKQNLDRPLSTAYDNVINFLNKKRKAKEIFGIGENIVTEILMSYDPNKFANLNDNPLTVLQFFEKKFPNSSAFKGKDYEEFVNLLTVIKGELGMRSLLEIDSFFNYVYRILMEE